MHGNIVEHLAAKMTQIVFVLVKREKKKIEREENECWVNTNTTSNEY